MLALEETRIARLGDLDLAQHLADDDLDVLVVDLHALQAIDVLNLPDQIVGQALDALQAQDVVRIRLTVGDDLAALDRLALEHVEMAPFRDQLVMLLTLLVRDDETPFAFRLLTEANRTRVLSKYRWLFRTTRLEQVRNTGQTARDVTRLGSLLRQTRQHVADENLRAALHR